MTLENIIKNDPTLDRFINGDIDWFNKHQVDLRCASLGIALAYYIDHKAKIIEQDIQSKKNKTMFYQFMGRLNRDNSTISNVFENMDEDFGRELKEWWDKLPLFKRLSYKHQHLPNIGYLVNIKTEHLVNSEIANLFLISKHFKS